MICGHPALDTEKKPQQGRLHTRQSNVFTVKCGHHFSPTWGGAYLTVYCNICAFWKPMMVVESPQLFEAAQPSCSLVLQASSPISPISWLCLHRRTKLGCFIQCRIPSAYSDMLAKHKGYQSDEVRQYSIPGHISQRACHLN